MKLKLFMALLVGVSGLAVYAGNVLATPQSGVTERMHLRACLCPSVWNTHSPVKPGSTPLRRASLRAQSLKNRQCSES